MIYILIYLIGCVLAYILTIKEIKSLYEELDSTDISEILLLSLCSWVATLTILIIKLTNSFTKS
jgi:hypothetical protein